MIHTRKHIPTLKHTQRSIQYLSFSVSLFSLLTKTETAASRLTWGHWKSLDCVQTIKGRVYSTYQ
jgi:hypothetical protein